MPEDKEFQWTDELALEFACSFDWINEKMKIGDRKIDYFKKLKSKEKDIPKQDWEILSFITNNGAIYRLGENGRYNYGTTEENHLDYSLNYFLETNKTIHSVKRSDGEIFSLGDDTDIGKITEFKICEDGSLQVINSSMFMWQWIGKIKKIKPKEPLFTYNAFQIFEGDIFWYTNKNVWKTYWQTADKETINRLLVINGYIPFATEEEAKEWHILNKPCLSVEDFISLWKSDNVRESPLIQDIKKLAQSKINP